MIDLLQMFQKRSFVLPSKHKKSKCRHYWYTVRSIHVKPVNKNVLLSFHSVSHVLDRDKTTRLGNKML